MIKNQGEGFLKLAVAGLPASLSGEVLSLHFKRSGFIVPQISANVAFDESSPKTLVANNSDHQPTSFSLESNYPNPFNPSTTIRYSLPETAQVKLEVFDMTGRSVSVLVDQTQAAGSYAANFDAASLPSGTYFYRIEAGQFTTTRKMTLVK